MLVVIERGEDILLFEQHEHAKTCGQLASLWRKDYFYGLDRRNSVIYAIYEHDNGWIELDEKPLLNMETLLPYSFIDYPLKPKLEAYTTCIDRIAKRDHYAALLCSLHYTSFFENYTNGRGEDFLTKERKRQKLLKKGLEVDEESLEFHYNLLQFCDNLSLYLCMNEPGVTKKDEFLWFRKGFFQKFSYNDRRKLIAHWLDDKTVSLSDFPFEKEVCISVNYKIIKKNRVGYLQEDYENTKIKQRVVTIVKEGSC